MRTPSKSDVKRVQSRQGFPIFHERSRKDFDLTLGGIRTNVGGPTGQSVQDDEFDDYIWALWLEHGREQFLIVPATTDPGLAILKNFPNPQGAAILVPGFHQSLWKAGRHSRINNAFRQNASVTVFRDRDRDNYLDMGPNVPKDHGIHWINLHPATYSVGGRSYKVGRWSAGCQVTQTWNDFAKLRDLRDEQTRKVGSSITSYSLHTADQY